MLPMQLCSLPVVTYHIDLAVLVFQSVYTHVSITFDKFSGMADKFYILR